MLVSRLGSLLEGIVRSLVGIEFWEKFAPVVKWATLRAMHHCNCYFPSLGHFDLDVNFAFLNNKVAEEIYMKQPTRFVVAGQDDLVCLLNNSLYSLCQGYKAYYNTLHLVLLKLGWVRSSYDSNLYYFCQDGEIVSIMTQVDDFYLTGSSNSLITHLKQQIQQEFNMKDLGHAQKYLGIELESNPDGILFHERSYLQHSKRIPHGLFHTYDYSIAS